MDFIEVGKFMVEPFELEQILEVKIHKKMNEHVTFYLHGVIKNDTADSLMNQLTEKTQITFKNEDQIIFCGILQDVNISLENAVYYVEAWAISYSILLDLKPMKRSFQTKGQSFQEIADYVIQDANALMAFHAPEKSVENIVLQYNETDWQFVKRLASHSNSVLIPSADSDKPEFLFGIPNGMEYKDKLEAYNYAVSKKMNLYRLLSQSDELQFQEEDAVIYTLVTEDFAFDIGDMLSLNNSALYVYETKFILKNSVLTCTYSLSSKTAISVLKSYNKDIAGLTLTGTVLKAEGDKVKVHLTIDGEQEEGKAYPFSYATVYTAEEHTGWYCMPEVGDTVQVLFPTEDENDGYAKMAIRQSDTEKTSDPKVKYLRTPEGKEIKLQKDEILITSKDDVTFIKINETTGIEIITDKDIQVKSGGSISVNADDKISMTSGNDFSIHSGKNLNISAADSISVTCRDNAVKLETQSTGIEVNAKKPIKMSGGDTIDVNSQKKLTVASSDELLVSAVKKFDVSSKETLEASCKENSVKLESGGSGILIDSGKAIKVSGKDTIDITSKKDLGMDSSTNLNVSAGKTLALSADSSIDSSCKGSSIKMDGNIDMKAKLIKEN